MKILYLFNSKIKHNQYKNSIKSKVSHTLEKSIILMSL